MWEDNRGWTEDALLWIMDSYFIQEGRFEDKSLNDGFVSNKHTAFTSQDWGIVVVFITMMFLSAVWTLILTAPIHCRGSIGEQVM